VLQQSGDGMAADEPAAAGDNRNHSELVED
jgi:hypothetical protein